MGTAIMLIVLKIWVETADDTVCSFMQKEKSRITHGDEDTFLKRPKIPHHRDFLNFYSRPAFIEDVELL